MNPKSTVQTSALKVNVCENTARKWLQTTFSEMSLPELDNLLKKES